MAFPAQLHLSLLAWTVVLEKGRALSDHRRSTRKPRGVAARRAADHARLTVLGLPILRPLNDWKPEYREYRRLILQMLTSLPIRHFDLILPLNKALADGVIVTETGDDLFWHPSPEVAAYFAKYL